MKDKYIKVTVSGLPKTGKTTIAELIGEALGKIGFDVSLETDASDYHVPDEALKAVLDSKIKVFVQERDANSFNKSTQPLKVVVTGRPTFSGENSRLNNPETPLFSGVDEKLTCIACGLEFVFTAGEQKSYQFRNHKAPKRCKTCLEVKRRLQNNGHAA